MPGLLLDQPLDRRAIGVAFRLVAQVQHDTGAAARRSGAWRWLHRKIALAIRRPHPSLVGAGAARNDLDAPGDHEGRIKPDPEPADQHLAFGALPGLCRLSALPGFDPVEKSFGARTRDGAE